MIGYIIDTGVKATPANSELRAPYYAKVIGKIENGSYELGRIRLGVYERSSENQDPQESDQLIGEYTHNYWHPRSTFHPFELRGKWYALYSKHYDVTSLMELPSCREIGRVPDDYFCPDEFWVPTLEYKSDGEWVFPDRIHGFVAGCMWADDCCLKVQYLDLSRADEGIIERHERFGYIAIPEGMTLKKALSFHPADGVVTIRNVKHYFIATGEEDYNW